MADFREILRDIKNRNFAQVYIFMGEEPYYIDKLTEALENGTVAEEDREFDQSVLYGADSTPGMVVEAAGRFPMMAEKRLVMLKEAQSMPKAKSQLDKLTRYIETPTPEALLVIAFKGDKLNATSDLIKAAKKNKNVIIFDSPKIKDYNLAKVIKDFCFSEKINIEEKAIEVLIANVGASLTNIFSEIEKLKIIVKRKDQHITADLVHEHIGVSKEFNNFELTTALANRNYYQSVRIIKFFEENPKNNPTQVTASIIFNYFQRLLIAAFQSDKSEKSLMNALQLKTPYALREIRTGLANYNASQLVSAIHLIREFDTKSKGIASMQKEFPLLLELVCKLLTL